MKTNLTGTALMAMCLGLALSATAFAHDPKDAPQPNMPMKKTAPMSMDMDASMHMHKAMMPAKSMEMPMTGDVDKDFATMMTMHHQMAIDMVDIYAKSGHNAKLKAMAMKMKAAQQAEIKQMAAFK